MDLIRVIVIVDRIRMIGIGYELAVDIFGIFSMFSNNYMHLYNAFTWLNIAL